MSQTKRGAMGKVVHFELFAEDAGRLVDFYTKVFGWDVSAWEGPFEYHLVSTGPRSAAGIDGAIAPFGSAGDQRVVVTVDSADIDSDSEKVLAAGGAAVTEKQAIPGTGWMRYFRDPSGLVFGIMQADRAAGIPEGVIPPAEEAAADPWEQVGERLREFGATLSTAVQEAAGSPQAQRLREQAEKAAVSIGEASKTAADKARPHVITALDRVSAELGELATRLRTQRAEAEGEPGEGETATGSAGESVGAGGETGTAADTDAPAE